MEQYQVLTNVPIPDIKYGPPTKREPFADGLMRLKLTRPPQCIASGGLSYPAVLRAAKTISEETGRKFVIRRVDGDYYVWRISPR